jgi:hypothetical protein
MLSPKRQRFQCPDIDDREAVRLPDGEKGTGHGPRTPVSADSAPGLSLSVTLVEKTLPVAVAASFRAFLR